MSLTDYIEKISNLSAKGGYSLSLTEKALAHQELLAFLDLHHTSNCPQFSNFRLPGINESSLEADIDRFLPAKLFKDFDWISRYPGMNGGKTFLSSGTSGSSRSRIFIDALTSKLQRQSFSKLFCSFVGKERLPMLILGSARSREREELNATHAGSAAFMLFAKRIFYAYDDEGNIDVEEIRKFYASSENNVYIFGLTSTLYKYLGDLLKTGLPPEYSGTAHIIHGGGWKKLADAGLGDRELNEEIRKIFQDYRLIEYYGLVEQLGTIFFKCNFGFFHCSDLSDITIFGKDGNVLNNRNPGMIGITSLLPLSYPGHRILTEDHGAIENGSNDEICSCGVNGKFFSLFGRLPMSELRGCANVN